MKKINWKYLNDNEVLIGKGFYISYNSFTSASKSGLGGMFNALGGVVGALAGIELETDGRAETALCVKQKGGRTTFFILNGDFRKEYEIALKEGLTACKKVYKANIKNKSNWSTQL